MTGIMNNKVRQRCYKMTDPNEEKGVSETSITHPN